MTQTSVPGSKLPGPRARSAAGFTLIELLVVVAMVAIATGLISLSLPDPTATQLERESSRLIALFESARAEARASGLLVQWAPVLQTDGGAGDAQFRFQGLPEGLALPTRWLGEAPTVEIVGARAVRLGPEPMIGAQRVVLRRGQQVLTLATDGLAPFAIDNSGERQP